MSYWRYFNFGILSRLFFPNGQMLQSTTIHMHSPHHIELHMFPLCTNFPFLFIIPFLLIFILPRDRTINTSLHTLILHCLPPPQCSILRLVFVFLSRSGKSKENCIYKREHKSKNITIPARMTAHFAVLCVFFFQLLSLWTLSFVPFKYARQGRPGQERMGRGLK